MYCWLVRSVRTVTDETMGYQEIRRFVLYCILNGREGKGMGISLLDKGLRCAPAFVCCEWDGQSIQRTKCHGMDSDIPREEWMGREKFQESTIIRTLRLS